MFFYSLVKVTSSFVISNTSLYMVQYQLQPVPLEGFPEYVFCADALASLTHFFTHSHEILIHAPTGQDLV